MAVVPAKSKGFFAGFVADLRKIQATDPETHPAAAIEAILKGAIPRRVRQKYERPENRIADIEQFAVLAAKYDSLERLIAELLLAGDVYGMDSLAAVEPAETLVLSTVHQAKGLEWSRVFVPRLIEESFPNHPRPRRARRRGRGAADLLRRGHPGDERALPDLSLVDRMGGTRTERPDNPKPVPDRSRSRPLRAGRARNRPRPHHSQPTAAPGIGRET